MKRLWLALLIPLCGCGGDGLSEFDKTLGVRSVVAAQWGPWSEVRTFTTAPEPTEPPPPEPVKHGKGWGKGGKK